MQAYVDAGLTTFDMADHYGPAEAIFGQFNEVNTHTHKHIRICFYPLTYEELVEGWNVAKIRIMK